MNDTIQQREQREVELKQMQEHFNELYVDYQFKNASRLNDSDDIARKRSSLDLSKFRTTNDPDVKYLNLNMDVDNTFIWDINDAKYTDFVNSNMSLDCNSYQACMFMGIACATGKDIIITKKNCLYTSGEHAPHCLHRNVTFTADSPIVEIELYSVVSGTILNIFPNSTKYELNYILPSNVYYRVFCKSPVKIEYDLYHIVDNEHYYDIERNATFLQFDLPGGTCISSFGNFVLNRKE
jgi:hypothetical protein